MGSNPAHRCNNHEQIARATPASTFAAMDCGAFLRAAGPRPTTRCGCATTAGHSSCRPTRRWGGKALRGSTRPLAGRGWLPPPADKQEGWDTGGDFTSSSDEEDDEDLDLFPEEVCFFGRGPVGAWAAQPAWAQARSALCRGVPWLVLSCTGCMRSGWHAVGAPGMCVL